MTYNEAEKLKKQVKAYFAANTKAIDAANKQKHILNDYYALDNKFVELKSNFDKADKVLKDIMDVIQSNSVLYDNFNKKKMVKQKRDMLQRESNENDLSFPLTYFYIFFT